MVIVMALIDNVHYFGGEGDGGFLRIVDSLENCPHLETYGICERCLYYNGCVRLFTGLSNRSAHHRLKDKDVSYYRRKYQRLAGISV